MAAFKAIVVNHVELAADYDCDFIQVGEDVRLYKQEEDGFQGLYLGVDIDVYRLVHTLIYRGTFIMDQAVTGELRAAGVNAPCLICKVVAFDHFVLELDVGQLVF